MREDGERDAFFWVRGRTPSLDDPYVWFDPINPERPQPRAEAAADAAEAPGAPASERIEGETAGERNGRSRRRRGRGRGRDRSLDAAPTAEAGETIEAAAEPAVSDADAAPVEEAPALIEQPKRRRVRRKVAADLAAEPDVAAEEVAEAEAPSVAEPAPVEEPAPAVPEPRPLPEPTVDAVEAAPAQPEVDVAALISEDPNQIVAPPEKPKRGWWRR